MHAILLKYFQKTAVVWNRNAAIRLLFPTKIIILKLHNRYLLWLNDIFEEAPLAY